MDRESNVVNFFETVLSAGVGPADLVFFVESTEGLVSPAYIVIDPKNPALREVIFCDGVFTAGQVATTDVANRYLEGSAAEAGLVHAAGARVIVAPLSQHIVDLHDRVTAVGVVAAALDAALTALDADVDALDLAKADAEHDADHDDRFLRLIGGTLTGPLLLPDGTVGAPAAARASDTNTGLYWSSSPSRLKLGIDGVEQYTWATTTFFPGATNGTVDLGGSSARWKDVWAANGTIQTSDEAAKNSVADSDLGLEFVRALRPVQYKTPGGTRPHYGLLAQQVRQALDQLGVDDFAGYIDPAVGAPPASANPFVGNAKEADDAEFDRRVAELGRDLEPGEATHLRKEVAADRQRNAAEWEERRRADLAAPKGLRYDEFIAPLIRAVQEQDAVIAEQAERIDALEAKVAAFPAIEARLAALERGAGR